MIAAGKHLRFETMPLMIRRLLVLLLLSCLQRGGLAAADADPGPEKKLIVGLFQSYDPTVRPRLNASETVDVGITYHLTSIQSVEEKTQTISLVGWATIEWRDDYLTWDPSEYGGITMVVVPVDKIWTPDLVFENSVGDRFFDVKFFRPRIYSSGAIAWEPGGPMDLACGFVLVNYPFDVQKCHMKLDTWANSGSKVMSYAVALDVESYEKNGGWTLINTDIENSSYTLDGETYTENYFYITIRRLPLFHIMNILVPVILLSVLNLLVFCLPAESKEKVTLSLTVLLAFSVWLLMMNGIMPSTSVNVPVMGIYITTFMGISSVSVLVTVLVIRMHEQTDNYQLPKWAVKLYGVIQRGCHCKRSDESRKRHGEPAEGDDEISWKRVAHALDLLAFYVFALIILVLTGIVVGNLLVFSANTVTTMEL